MYEKQKPSQTVSDKRDIDFGQFFKKIAKPAIATVAGKMKRMLEGQRCYELDDIVQQVMLKFIRKGPDYFRSMNEGEMVGCFLRAVRNECINIYHKPNQTSLEEDTIGVYKPESNVSEAAEYESLLPHLLKGLTDIQKTIVLLRGTGDKFKEIATELNIKDGLVKYHFYKAQEHIANNYKSIKKQEERGPNEPLPIEIA